MIRAVFQGLVGALSLALATGQALGACGSNACDNMRIERLYPSGRTTPTILIKMQGNMSSLTCQLHEGQFLALEDNHPVFDEIYAMLLSTMHADRPLGRVRVSDTGPCNVGYVWQDQSNLN